MSSIAYNISAAKETVKPLPGEKGMQEHRKLLRDRTRLLRGFMAIDDHLPRGAMRVYLSMRFGIGHDQAVSFSQEKAGRVSYARCTADRTDNTRRVRTTFSRYVRRQLNLGASVICDQALQVLSARIMGHCVCGSGFISLVRGEDITNAYRDSFGGSSCMCGDAARYVQIYADNPDKVAMAKYSNGVDARALLWTCDDGTTYLDRIYPSDNGPHVEAMRVWAEKQGYKHRGMNRSATRGLTVSVDYDGDEYPYCDTFTTCDDHGDGDIVLRADKNGEYTLDSTSGYRSDGGYVCEACGDRVGEEDYYSSNGGDIYCSDCYSERFFTCEKCEEETDTDDGICVDGNSQWCSYCANSNAVQCADCGEYSTDDYYVTEDTERAYCSNCIDNNAQSCEECGEYNETTETIDEEEYCENCAPDKRKETAQTLLISIN